MKVLTLIAFLGVAGAAYSANFVPKSGTTLLPWGYSRVDTWVYNKVMAPVESGLACDLLVVSNLCYLIQFQYKEKYLSMSEDVAKNFFNCYPRQTREIWTRCQVKAFKGKLDSAENIWKAFCQKVPYDNDALDVYDRCLMATYKNTLSLQKMEDDIEDALACQGTSVYLTGPRFDAATYALD